MSGVNAIFNSANVGPAVPQEPLQTRMHNLLALARRLNAETECFEQRLMGYPAADTVKASEDRPYGMPSSIEHIESELRAALSNVERFSGAL